MERSGGRPAGVMLLAILAIAGGSIVLLLWLPILLNSLAVPSAIPAQPALLGLNLTALGVPIVLGALLSLTFGFGALLLQSWAWWVGIISQALSLVGAIAAVGNGSSFGAQTGVIIISGLILGYLATPDVRRAFSEL